MRRSLCESGRMVKAGADGGLRRSLDAPARWVERRRRALRLKLLRELPATRGSASPPSSSPNRRGLVAPLSAPVFPWRSRVRTSRSPGGFGAATAAFRRPCAPRPGRASLVRRVRGGPLQPLFTALFHEPGLPHFAALTISRSFHHPEFFDSNELSRRAAFRAASGAPTASPPFSSATRDDAVGRPASIRRSLRHPAARRPAASALSESALVARLAVNGLARVRTPPIPPTLPHKNPRAPARRRRTESSDPARLPPVPHRPLDTPRSGSPRGSGRRPRRVVRVSVPDETDVAALIQGARFLSYPPFEGFGLRSSRR